MEILKKIREKKVIAGIAALAVVVIVAGVICAKIFIFSGWIVKIDGKRVSFEEFNNLYYAQMRMAYNKSNEEIDKLSKDPASIQQNPMLKKSDFLNSLIQNKLLYFKALSEGYENNKEAKILTEYQVLNVVGQFYAETVIKNNIVITEKEISDTYIKYQSQFNGLPVQMVSERIKNTLQQQKLSEEYAKKLEEVRKNAQLDRNEDLMTKLSDPDKSKRPAKGTLVKISGKNITTKEISVEDFTTGYYAQLKFIANTDEAGVDKIASDPALVNQNPLLNKKKFLDQIIDQYLLYEEARNKGLLENKDLKALLVFYKEQALYLYYLKDKYSKDTVVTDQEITMEYNRVKKQLPPNMMPDQAIAYIRQNIEQQKVMQKVNEMVTNLKDHAVIEKNMSLIEDSQK
jgi:hypothetical protein